MRCVAWFRAWLAAAVVMACGLGGACADPLLEDVADPAAQALDDDDSPINKEAPAMTGSLASLAFPETGGFNGFSLLKGGALPEDFLFFSGFDLWRGGGSGHAGMLWAPEGLNKDGFILKLLIGEGSYRYRAGATDIQGAYLLGSLMGGWRWSRDTFELKAFAGPDLQYHRLTPFDPASRLAGSNIGARIGVELWWQLNPDIMVSSSLSASTIGMGYGARTAAGWRVTGLFYAGPEIETSGDLSYRQFRAGLHATALKTGDFEWTVAAGYVVDNSQRSGVYGRIGVLTRR